MSPIVPRPLPPLAGGSPVEAVLLDLMILCWLLAVVIAVWGAVGEAGRADRARRRELETEVEPGPTPGIDGFLERWGLWSLVLAGVGLVLLGVATHLTRA